MVRLKKLSDEEKKNNQKESGKRWYWSHKEFKNQRYKEWYNENKEKRSEYSKQWREENKEYDKKRRKEYTNTPKGRAVGLCSKYNYEDEIKGRSKGDLTAKWIVDNIFTKPCAHCGKTGWEIIGCNRLDNSKPHTMDNVEPCCEECNKKEWFKEMRKQVYQYTTDGILVKIWNSAKDAAEKLSISRRSICKCCNNKLKTYKGFIWSYELII